MNLLLSFCYICYLYLKLRVIWEREKASPKRSKGVIIFIYSIDKEWKKDVLDVKKIGDLIISLKFVVNQDIINLIIVYAPHERLEEHIKVHFWEGLDGLIQEIHPRENIFRTESKWTCKDCTARFYWKVDLRFLCDTKVNVKLKRKFYRATTRRVMLYETKF